LFLYPSWRFQLVADEADGVSRFLLAQVLVLPDDDQCSGIRGILCAAR
jgi:hypothetical protein